MELYIFVSNQSFTVSFVIKANEIFILVMDIWSFPVLGGSSLEEQKILGGLEREREIGVCIWNANEK